MRILHVINTLDARDGGPPPVLAGLAIAQARLGHEVAALAYADGPSGDARGVLATVPGGELVRVIPVARGGRLERLTARRAGRVLAAIDPAPDFVHLHGVWPAIIPRASALCRALGWPYAVIPHGSLNAWTMRERTLKKKIALSLTHGRTLPGAAFVHVTNSQEHDSVRALGYRGPIELIPPGVSDEALGQHDDAALRARCPALGTARYVLFVARLHPGKGVELLIEAMHDPCVGALGLHAVIAGPDAGMLEPSHRQIARLGLAHRVHLVGALGGGEKYGAMAGAVALVMPSKGESFGMSIAEALGVGCPAVVSPECDFSDIERERCGVIVPREPGAIADAIVQLASDEPARRDMLVRGRALVRARYTWPTIAQRMLHAYITHNPARR